MASAFGHAFVALALGTGFSKALRSSKFWLLGIACSILPDADVISFGLGIPYEHVLGHRGFTHSLLFALILGFAITMVFYPSQWRTKSGATYMLFFALCTASHALLDAMTSGGLGVAFFAPFDNTRYFLPWRPIQVSPIGVENFFSEWGKRVLLSEAIWIGIPASAYMLFVWIVKRIRSRI